MDNSEVVLDNGIVLDSEYKTAVYEFCTRNGITVSKGPSIKYDFNGHEASIDVDFTIDNKHYEVTDGLCLSGATFDDRKAKIDALKKAFVTLITDKETGKTIPRANGTESNGHKYLRKCAFPLIGVDVDLFKNPDFPYAKDRPACFYRTKFNKEMSPLEAWNDEKLRWKMIVNRIDYAGGFIDAKAILTAFNVTRTSKQASWFSRKFAKELITNYLEAGTKIIDPFAGWGERCHAALELGRDYQGYDANQEVVDWMKNPHYALGDATKLKLDDDNVSVFSCPPYSNVEEYFDGQLNLPTEGWIDIVIQNIPNAKEYLFVCKKPGKYEAFQVDAKVNKSHFGSNFEHVVYFTQKDRQDVIIKQPLTPVP
jgi:hypothetical protein